MPFTTFGSSGKTDHQCICHLLPRPSRPICTPAVPRSTDLPPTAAHTQRPAIFTGVQSYSHVPLSPFPPRHRGSRGGV